MNDEPQLTPTNEDELRKEAVKSIQRKRGFKQTVLA